jgi:hypothetical protein
MLLHIFLGDEVLFYFIVGVEVIENQIWFEFKLVCKLQKGLTQSASSRAWPMRPS